jgi:hypothetical protein
MKAIKAKEVLARIKEEIGNKATKVCIAAGTAAGILGGSLGINAEEGVGTEVMSAFSGGLDQVKTDFLSMLGAAMPVALSIAGVGLAISLAWRYFKKLGK